MSNKLHTTTWVVVTDSSQAKIYRLVKFPKIEEISYFEHPESRLHDQDLVTSRPGRGFQSMGNARYSYQQEVEPKKQEAIKFAKSIARYLISAEEKNEFDRLYVIAEPTFLGLLRQNMTPGIRKKIVAELSKNLTTCDVATIENHLAEL
jgi:protein required for attachment to host cells